jgi:DMSO/TMAO reductase YedYZ molybdopterin-dependent catalytic subunit
MVALYTSDGATSGVFQLFPHEVFLSQPTRIARRVRRPVIPEALAARVPPGQIIASRWPVLHQGAVPEFDPSTWDFRVWGRVAAPLTWSWEAFQRLPIVSHGGDLHCVTRWSSLDHLWSGVASRTVAELAGVQPDARFVVLHGEAGYTANLPLEVFLADDVMLATKHDGEPLSPQHGAPVRAVMPGRYAWKSVKWLRGIEFVAHDQPGFWERYGYSNSADPWREERFEP